MLQLDGVRWSEGDFTLTADWSADPGDRIAVIGPSGAGKSTLLALIAGFLAPSAGRITWQGRDLGPLAPGDRPISILFQDQNLFPHLTLTQNLGLGLSPNLRLGPDDAARIDAALTRVGLADLGSRKPGQLSGGQQSRAALARALLRARPILLLDEPFVALGPALKTEMLTLVREVADATSALTLLVTHDPNDARQFGSRTILVDAGRAAPPQDTETLFAHPPSGLRDYLGT